MLTNDMTRTPVRWPASFNEVPKEVFYRRDVYQRELERIFYGPEWYPIAHEAELPARGDYKTARIGEAPLLVLRGQDDVVRVFSNSCPHRGTQLATCARGNARTIECPYHRWTFDTQGRLIGVPGAGDFPSDFRKEDFGLQPVRSEKTLGIIFATFSHAAPSLDEYLEGVPEHARRAFGGDDRLVLLGSQKVVFDANWKEYNDSDGYHGPLLHAAFNHLKFAVAKGTTFMTRYTHKVNAIEMKNVENSGFLNDHSVIEARDLALPVQTTVITFFPLAQIIRNLDSISLRYAFPLSPDQTEVHFVYFGRADDDDALRQHRVRQVSNLQGPSGLISLEDGAVFNRQHVGAHAPGKFGFHKGYKGPIAGPCALGPMEESGNVVRWEHYRRVMGFERMAGQA